MGEIIARNMFSWLKLLINCYCCICWLFMLLYQRCTATQTSNLIIEQIFKKRNVLWFNIPISILHIYVHLGGSHWFHPYDKLKAKVEGSFATSVHMYQTARRNVPLDSDVHILGSSQVKFMSPILGEAIVWPVTSQVYPTKFTFNGAT